MRMPDVGGVLAALRDCAAAALDPVPGRVSLYSGAQEAWDDCCSGQLWVRLISAVPGSTQTAGARGYSQASLPCGALSWSVTAGIGVLRCAATVDDNGVAPAPVELNAETLQMTADVAALSRAIECCGAGIQGIEKLTSVSWTPKGPSGGCVGGEWTVTFLVLACNCDVSA